MKRRKRFIALALCWLAMTAGASAGPSCHVASNLSQAGASIIQIYMHRCYHARRLRCASCHSAMVEAGVV